MNDNLNKYDLIFSNATVIDGSGEPRFKADVAVKNGVIVDICKTGKLPEEAAKKVITLAGCVLSPGFIDVHTHDDNAVIKDPTMKPKVSQGVTTVIVGKLWYKPVSDDQSYQPSRAAKPAGK